MMSLDSRLEQIRQRGELLRKQRKNRRRKLLTACVAVALCICVIALWPRQPENPRNNAGGISAGTGNAADGMSLLNDPIGAKVIYGDKVFTGAERVDQILDWVQTVTAPIPPMDAPPEANETPTQAQTETEVIRNPDKSPEDLENYGTVSDSSSADLIFTVEENGVITVYKLTPTHLIDTQAGVQYPISKEQYDMFMEWML